MSESKNEFGHGRTMSRLLHGTAIIRLARSVLTTIIRAGDSEIDVLWWQRMCSDNACVVTKYVR